MHYLVGDIQGCYASFKALLEKLSFSPSRDRLILVGDLVARGEDSLATMRYILDNQDAIDVVLGNHDLHLLAVSRGFKRLNPKDNTSSLLVDKLYPDVDRFLRHQPLVRDYKDLGILAVHAGIWPSWTPKRARKRSAEIETLLQDDDAVNHLLSSMYGNGPKRWSKHLEGDDRHRAIINICTRMRALNDANHLDMNFKGALNKQAQAEGLRPWFESDFDLKGRRIAFGHWAALEGDTGNNDHVIALDTGCVWGGSLTAYAVEDDQFISVTAV